MPAKKTKAKAATEPRRFRVLKAFGYEGTIYYSAHNADRINDLPEFEIEDRIARGFIVELPPRAPATTDAGE